MKSEEKYIAITLTEAGNSTLEKAIRSLPVAVCSVFLNNGAFVPAGFTESDVYNQSSDFDAIARSFPLTIGAHGNRVLIAKNAVIDKLVTGKRVAVLFSGGPASGGHNVIVGLKKILGNENTLLGIKGGPKGLIDGEMKEVTEDDVKFIFNTGGFDYIGSDRTKIKTDEQFKKVKDVCKENNINAIVVIGGDDSNTNAGILAEKLFKDVHDDGSGVQVIGVPKTIDGDLQVGSELPITFGYHTATSIYSELVGNILQDTPSSRKYWHFIKLMGRSASHVTLEVALQTKPAVSLISEEIAEKKTSLDEIVSQIADTVVKRSRNGMNYGVVLVPEGLIEFIPEITVFLEELNDEVSSAMKEEDYRNMVRDHEYIKMREIIYPKLSDDNVRLMKSFPGYIQDMLLAERDSHGNLPVSLIPTERLLIDMVDEKVREIDRSIKFSTHKHFFGYEGRCGVPTKFDMAFCLNLGMTAGSLILDGRTGYIASVADIDSEGRPLGLPLTGLFNIERRHGKDEMVIEKSLVDLNSEAFKYFESRRGEWADSDRFTSPGPRQLWGPASNRIPETLFLNIGKHFSRTFVLGRDHDIFQDELKKAAEFFLIKHGMDTDLLRDSIRERDDEAGIEYCIFPLSKDVKINNKRYEKGTRIAVNKYGNIYVIKKEMI